MSSEGLQRRVRRLVGGEERASGASHGHLGRPDGIEGWLEAERFPGPQSSKAFLAWFVAGTLGATDQRIIAEQVASRVRDTLEIAFEWRGDENLHAVTKHVQRTVTRER